MANCYNNKGHVVDLWQKLEQWYGMKEAVNPQRVQFESLRALCEDNPAHFIEVSSTLANEYPLLGDLQFRLLDAYAHTMLGKANLALPMLEEILGKAITEKDLLMMVYCYLLLAKCYEPDIHKQQSCLKIAEDTARQSGDSFALAEALSGQGNFLYVHKNYKEAEEKHLMVQKLLEKVHSPTRKMRSLVSLANINVDYKQPLKAIAFFNEALEICRSHEHKNHELIILNRLAMIQIDQGHYQDAKELLNKAITLCDEIGLTVQKIQAIFSLGALYLKMKCPDDAQHSFEQSASLATKVGFSHPMFLVDLHYNRGEVNTQKGDIPAAIDCFDLALGIAKEQHFIEAIHEIYIAKAKILMSQKRYLEAEQLLKQSLKASQKEISEAMQDEAMELLAKLYHKMKDYPKCVQTQAKHITQLRAWNKELKQRSRECVPNKIHFNFQSSHDLSLRDSKAIDNYGFIGNSPAHKKVLDAALLAAGYPNVNVILMGESGTGKEVIANLIHHKSLRKYHAFVPFNAAAISAHLVESELFGHTKGSFTGATNDSKGFFQMANKGTLFIDEISEMPLEVQAKLLRAIESKKVNPVGSSSEIAVDCRIISATNLDIYDLIKTNHFRLDLFHRINTIEIFIPPLRERIEDIPLLVEYFINHYAKEFGKDLPSIKASFVQALQGYDFPGNVRELKNLIERLFILSNTHIWDDSLLENLCCNFGTQMKSSTQHGFRSDSEEELIKQALIRCKGLQKEAAKLLNMSDSTLSRRIIKYKLDIFTRKSK